MRKHHRRSAPFRGQGRPKKEIVLLSVAFGLPAVFVLGLRGPLALDGLECLGFLPGRPLGCSAEVEVCDQKDRDDDDHDDDISDPVLPDGKRSPGAGL